MDSRRGVKLQSKDPMGLSRNTSLSFPGNTITFRIRPKLTQALTFNLLEKATTTKTQTKQKTKQKSHTEPTFPFLFESPSPKLGGSSLFSFHPFLNPVIPFQPIHFCKCGRKNEFSNSLITSTLPFNF